MTLLTLPLQGFQYALVAICMVLAVTVINNVILPVFYENQILNCYEVRSEIKEGE